MQITSLGLTTNLMFSRFSGVVSDKGIYTVVQTPSNPGYHWGNYLIFDRSPRSGDLQNWTRLFKQEFTYYSEPEHYLFVWESNRLGMGDSQQFLDAGFDRETTAVLTTDCLTPPARINHDLRVKNIESEDEWNEVVELQILCADPKYVNANYRRFKQLQMNQYRQMSQAGLGFWFGGFLGDKLVGDLGIFWDKAIGRYQNVGTHPMFRRQGICGSLVYQTGLSVMREFTVSKLVMEADPDYYAARIYESVGFQQSETYHALTFWKGKQHSPLLL